MSTADFRLPGPRHFLKMLAVYVGVAAAVALAFLIVAAVVAKPVQSGAAVLLLASVTLYLRSRWRWNLRVMWRRFSVILDLNIRFPRSKGADTHRRSAK